MIEGAPIRLRRALGFYLTAAFLFPSAALPAAAGSITLEITPSVAREKGGWKIAVDVANSGDDTAYGMSAGVRLSGLSASSDSPAAPLSPGGRRSFVIRLKGGAAPLGPGDYPLFIWMDYADANHYPFSATALSQVSQGKPAPQAVMVLMDGAELSDKASVLVRAKNIGGRPLKARASLFLSHDLSAEGAQELDLNPEEEASRRFKIKKFSALPGSTYPVYAVLDYDLDGAHRFAAALSTVRVVDRAPGVLRPWMAAAALLVLAFAWAARSYAKS